MDISHGKLKQRLFQSPFLFKCQRIAQKMSSGNHVPAIVHSPPKPAKQNSHHKLSCVLVVAVVGTNCSRTRLPSLKSRKKEHESRTRLPSRKGRKKEHESSKGSPLVLLTASTSYAHFFFLICTLFETT